MEPEIEQDKTEEQEAHDRNLAIQRALAPDLTGEWEGG